MQNTIVKLAQSLESVKTLAFDYDGTLAPPNVPREESRVFHEFKEALVNLRSKFAIVIVTTKDCSFVIKRTPFAHAWACSNGFEIRFQGVSIFPSEILDDPRRSVLEKLLNKALELGQRYGIFIEIKRVGCTNVGFCIDWRGKISEPPDDVKNIVSEAKQLGLSVIEYPNRPFIDVFLTRVDKSWALQKMLELGIVKRPIAYFGDSENDIPAFRIADISIQIVHEENRWMDLGADYRITHDELAELLRNLAHGLKTA